MTSTEVTVPMPDGGKAEVKVGAGTMGPPGRDGAPGPRGLPGSSTQIVGVFGNLRSPDELPNTGIIPADWDGPGRPAAELQLQYGWSMQHEPTGNLWVFVSVGNWPSGWLEVDGGVRGPPGPDGPIGPPGPVGLTGPVGPPGVQGPTGAKGDIGERGPEGPLGPIGDRGPQGFPGPPGNDGEQGLPGDKGDTGERGEQGDKGDTGDTGERGAKWWHSASAPPPAIDAASGILPGDFILCLLANTASPGHGDTYDVLANYQTVRSGNLLGPIGERGEKGDRGDQGEPGLHGYDGAYWFWSPSAPPDPTGKPGDWILCVPPTGTAPWAGDIYQMLASGLPNRTGNIRGPQGDKGDIGDRGPQGEQGPRGETDVDNPIAWQNLLVESPWQIVGPARYARHHGFLEFVGYLSLTPWPIGNAVIAKLPGIITNGPHLFYCAANLVGYQPANVGLGVLAQPNGDIILYSIAGDFPGVAGINYMFLNSIRIPLTPVTAANEPLALPV